MFAGKPCFSKLLCGAASPLRKRGEAAPQRRRKSREKY